MLSFLVFVNNHCFFFILGSENCDFDNGLCNGFFTQDKSDDFDFSLRIGSTPSWYTGPDVDHTTSRMGMYPKSSD